MATNYRLFIDPNQVCVTLRFDKPHKDPIFPAACAKIENGDECATIERMCEEAETTTTKMQIEGYTPSPDNEKIELCRSRFDRFLEDAKDFGEAILYLGSIGVESATDEVSDTAGSIWDSVAEFFGKAFRESSELRAYNRKIAPNLGIGYGVRR